MEDIKEENIIDNNESNKEAALFDKDIVNNKDNINKVLCYKNNDINKLNKAKLKSLIFGIILTSLGLCVFISEFFYKFDMDYLVDYYISIGLILDLVVGIILISRYFLMKEIIEADNIFNIVNMKHYYDNNEIKYKRCVSLLRIGLVGAIPLNVSLLTFYIMTLSFDIQYYSGFDVFVFYFTLILIILLFISIIISNIFLDTENEIYDDYTFEIKIKKDFKKNFRKNNKKE